MNSDRPKFPEVPVPENGEHKWCKVERKEGGTWVEILFETLKVGDIARLSGGPPAAHHNSPFRVGSEPLPIPDEDGEYRGNMGVRATSVPE